MLSCKDREALRLPTPSADLQSSRFDELADRISDKCRKWDMKVIESRFGPVPADSIPMWIADMDFKSPPAVARKFSEIISWGTFSYTHCIDDFYEAVINFQARHHKVAVEREWITLSYGTVSTLHYTVQAFCQPGDSIIMNTPVYDPFAKAAERQGVKVVANPLALNKGRYRIDLAKLEEQIISHKPKIYFLCSPHNPSGRIWSQAELEAVADICLRYQVLMMVDEVHAEHIIHGEFVSFLALEERYCNNMMLMSSPNKAFNLGGLKTSYSIIPNPQIRNRFRARLEQNSITSPNVFGLWGIITAYNECDAWLAELNLYLRENYALLARYFRENLPDFQVMPMDASYLVWVNTKGSGMSASEVTRRWAVEAGVIIEDGSHYVSDGEEYVRINIGTSRQLLGEALQRLGRWAQQQV
ncbi:MalY/PatB family protein [Aeromonas veronii]|uniref:MalY/PatB family protein n=1 Tax=Aeromonas veronii TaxID=654 RepID=UPI001F28681B|nr:PatB family C-S lyase [Aeromonas veronii]MCF5877426.1 PatB family C-S lyase [Aeromonas veronii]